MRAGRSSRSLPVQRMTAFARRFLRVFPAIVLLAAGCQGGDDGDRSDERERVQRVVSSYVAAYLDGRGEDACALYTQGLRTRIERVARRRGVRDCEHALELASDVLQSEQPGALRKEVREQLADPAAIKVRLRGERAWAALELPGSKSLSRSALELEPRDGEWRIARVGVEEAAQ
jgi:hypothetical protein